MMQLDLSRRRVAAISFLSNISVTELTDEQKSGQDNLHCLRVCTYLLSLLTSLSKPLTITKQLLKFFYFQKSKEGHILFYINYYYVSTQ